MSERYDILSPRAGKEKTYWLKVGTGFPRDKGGFSLVFDALPLPDKEGRVSLLMVPPKEKDKGMSGEQFKQVREAATGVPELDDSQTIPF